eukprot:3649429-Amphidinium_carterae.1
MPKIVETKRSANRYFHKGPNYRLCSCLENALICGSLRWPRCTILLKRSKRTWSISRIWGVATKQDRYPLAAILPNPQNTVQQHY